MKFTLGSALFCLGLAATFTACSDDSSSASDSKEIISCHTYNTVNEDATEINEDCIEAVKGTPAAENAKTVCKAFTELLGKTETDWAEIGKGCPEKKAVVTCDMGADSKIYYYSLDEDQQALIVEGDNAKTCENLTKDDD